MILDGGTIGALYKPIQNQYKIFFKRNYLKEII